MFAVEFQGGKGRKICVLCMYFEQFASIICALSMETKIFAKMVPLKCGMRSQRDATEILLVHRLDRCQLSTRGSLLDVWTYSLFSKIML